VYRRYAIVSMRIVVWVVVVAIAIVLEISAIGRVLVCFVLLINWTCAILIK
jgi:hypothetical protein